MTPFKYIDCTPEKTVSNGALKPVCNNLFLIKNDDGVSDPTTTPMPTQTSFPVDVICGYENSRCEAEGNENKKVNVDIANLDFIDLDNRVIGGAIRTQDR